MMDHHSEASAAINSLARTFCARVRADLADELDEIVRRNGTDEYSGCCATHDFCDANVLMLEAWAEVFGGVPDPMDDDFASIVNGAWALARAHDFDPPQGALTAS